MGIEWIRHQYPKDLSFRKIGLNIFSTDSNIKVIDDVYNASPDSMRAAIEVLKDLGEDIDSYFRRYA